MRPLLPAVLLAVLPAMGATVGRATASLTVVVRPEATLDVQGGATAVVKIRLRQGTQAIFATQDGCTGAPEQGFRIERSGTYILALEGKERFACLYTADKTIAQPIQPR